MASKNIKGINILIGGDTTGLAKALGDVNRQTNSLQSELKQVDRLLKLDPNNTVLLAQKQELLAKSVSTTTDKLQALKKARDEAEKNGNIEKFPEQYRALQREITKTEQELKGLEKQSKDFGNTFSQQMKNAGKGIQEFGAKTTDIGKKMLPVTGIIAGVGAASFKMAADMQDALGATDQIFGDASSSMKIWAKGLESYYGIASSEALEYGNMMGSMLKNIGGLTTEEAAKQSQTLIKLAGDLTAMYGGTTESAVQALTGALKGNNSMLDNYGMAVNDAMLKTKALEMGLFDGTSQMSLAAKQAATLALITEQSGAAQGQAAREAKGASGSMRAVATEIKNVTASIGELLLPIITPLIQKISEFTKWLGGLNEGQQKMILIIGGIIAIIPPLLILFGSMASAIGILTKAIAGMNLAFLASPIGQITAAIVIFSSILLILNKIQNETKTETEKLTEKIREENNAWDELKETQKEKAEANVAEIDYTKRLNNELKSLTDENGNVSEANRTRAEYIIGELNSALGLELKLTGNQIQGYKDAAAAIDNLILKKRAQIILDSQEEQYKTAVLNVNQKQMDQSVLSLEIMDKEAKMAYYVSEANSERAIKDQYYRNKMLENAGLERLSIEGLQGTYEENEVFLNDYYTTITSYEENTMAITSNNYDKIKEINAGVGESFKKAGEATEEELKKQVAVAGKTYADIQTKVDAGVKGVTQTMADEALVQYNNAVIEYQKIGKAIPDGMQVGIENGKATLKAKIGNFLATVKSWFTNKEDGFDERSPSHWSEQVANFVVEGLANGMLDKDGKLKKATEDSINIIKSKIEELEKDKDIVSANEKKRIEDEIKGLKEKQKEYENTAKAYVEASEFINNSLKGKKDDFDLSRESKDLDYKLWLETVGQTATEEEKAAKQAESLTNQYKSQNDTVWETQQSYNAMIEVYGVAHEESVRMENQLKKEKIALAEIGNQLAKNNSIKKEELSFNQIRNTTLDYSRWMKSNYSALKNMGVSDNQIQKTGSQMTGYDKVNNNTVTNNYYVATNGDTTTEFITKTRAVDKSKSMLGGAVFA